jgi:prolyl oligopeptidase
VRRAAALAIAVASMSVNVSQAAPAAPSDDPYLWLEDVEGAKALEWVKAQDAESQGELESKPEFNAIH